MKIFTQWIEEQHGTDNNKEVAVEVELTFTKMTPEIQQLIQGISQLHKNIFKKENGYTTKHIDNKGKVKDINEAYGISKSGNPVQLWKTII